MLYNIVYFTSVFHILYDDIKVTIYKIIDLDSRYYSI